MTREEAIEVLENPDVSIGVAARIGQDPEYWRKLKPALDMAISALRQQDVADKHVWKNEPLTNAQKIRSMNDEELNELFHEIYNAGAEDAVAYEWGQRTNSFEWTMEWLQQPAGEEDKHENLD